jgi:hypothetical protein
LGGDNATVGAEGPQSATGFTVTFAVAVVAPLAPAATASTAYVAVTVPFGTVFAMTTELDSPGPSVITLCENAVDHEEGSDDDRLNDRSGHVAESLFNTVSV